MSLNSEPIKENNDLLSLIDAGIAALREEDDDAPLTLDAAKVLPKSGDQK